MPARIVLSVEGRQVELEEKLKLQQKHIRNQRQQIASLRSRVERLESLLPACLSDPQLKWLFDNRDERMDPSVPIFDSGRAEFHLDRYRFAAQRVADKTVADIACGTGYGCELLLSEGGAHSVIGIDLCPQTIDYASDRHQTAGIEYRCASGDETGIADNSKDVVVSFETIEHVADDTRLLQEFARILKPGGILICSTPNMWPLEIAQHHVRVYDRQSFLTTLENRFNSIELFNQNSGTSFRFNRDQERGIVPTTDENHELAECFLAVARKA